ncbi:hypothetical protein CFP56_029397 [Quercus suber]|uniref:FAF domain-containing protein n=1 Tax=Quercus suber TaxID=58331 RepID=A0AAW0LVK3_QUESU
MGSPKESHTNQVLGHSLKALTLTPEKEKPTLSMLATASSWSTGDYIGMESCLDINEEVQYSSKDKNSGGESDSEVYIKKCRAKREQRRAMRQREFPPPIPLLARTENLPCHMPWVLKRHYTSDGRLILTEERVKHHEYFRAHRADGRLTLQLVPLDDEVWLPDDQCDYCESTKIEGGGIGGTATNAAGKRLNLNYNNVASPGSCIFEVPVQQYGQFIANTNLHLCDAISLGRA